jgi:hypothetical protein
MFFYIAFISCAVIKRLAQTLSARKRPPLLPFTVTPHYHHVQFAFFAEAFMAVPRK